VLGFDICPDGPSSPCTQLPDGGLAGADFMLYVTATETASCGDGTLAYASSCEVCCVACVLINVSSKYRTMKMSFRSGAG
jgi:hypothetical protein